MAKYRKKPVEIEAVEWKGNNLRDIYVFMGEDVTFNDWREQDRFHDLENSKRINGFYINTLEGSMKVNIGDFVIKGVNGEFYPCKPDIFEKTYELVE